MSAVKELSPEEFAALSRTSRAVPSPYEGDVRSAQVGKGYGIELSKDLQARTVVNNLHKAAKAVGVKVQVRVREKAVPPIVTFQVLPAVAAPVAVQTVAE